MNYFTAFEISAAGMGLERLRLDVAAVNLANVHTTRTPDGSAFRPLRVVAEAKAPVFEAALAQASGRYLFDTMGVHVRQLDTAPRMVFDPKHPDANESGFVAYPDINPVSEMISVLTATRAYEANVRAFNAAKTMALKALEIGGGA